jgi:hypothetical protein
MSAAGIFPVALLALVVGLIVVLSVRKRRARRGGQLSE